MKKKNAFFTFVFAMMPGAGQMYLGLMRRGVSMMLPFLGIIWFSWFFRISELMIFLPVVWFFAFFDTFNQRDALIRGEAVEDKFLINLGNDWKGIVIRRHTVIGWCCIALGGYMFYNTFFRSFLFRLVDINPILTQFFDRLPNLIVIALIILLGIYLVTGGKKKKAVKDEDYIEYGGDKNDRV